VTDRQSGDAAPWLAVFAILDLVTLLKKSSLTIWFIQYRLII